jgi:uncharacterized protein YqfB (UPF0267 family)
MAGEREGVGGVKIISFAWTTPQLLAGKKTVTRRDWSDKYARQFRAGDLVQVYDKSPRAGGKRVAVIEIKSIKLEGLDALRLAVYGPQEMINEGFPGRDPREFAADYFSRPLKHAGALYRVEFAVIELDTPDGEFLKVESAG